MKDIKTILRGIYNNPELRKTIVPLFLGNPGTSKTVQIKEFANEIGVNLVSFITSQRNPFEISGLAYPNKRTERMEFWDFDTMLNMKDGDILFFDEIFNGNPTVLNACLTILEEREMISGKKLPDIMIVAAANPQGMIPLTPQIKERFVWYKFELPKEDWMAHMRKKYKMPEVVSKKLCSLISSEDFKKDSNYHSARSIDKAVNMIINGVPSPYESELLPILDTLIENKLNKPFEIGKDRVLLPGEQISWLELIRINNNINPVVDAPINKINESNVDSFNDILIFDANDNIIGEIKDVESLEKMFYLNSNDIEAINNGLRTPFSLNPPVFFQKNKII